MAVTSIKTSEEEKAAREKICSNVNDVLSWKLTQYCTSCKSNISTSVATGSFNFHPLLNTLICLKCKNFYGDPNEFSTDEDGSDKYCRWCGQGGNIYSCSACPRAFCKKCIKNNLSRSYQAAAEKDGWKCLCCDPEPIWEQRAAAWLVQEYNKRFLKKKKKSAENGYEDKEYYPPGSKKTKKLGRSEAIPTLKHIHSAVHMFNSHIDKCTHFCQDFLEKSDDYHQKMRRLITSPDSANYILKDLCRSTNNLTSQLNDASQKLKGQVDQWSIDWEQKVKEEKEMEDRGELVNGRLVVSKKKKINKKLAATAGGGDSTDEDEEDVTIEKSKKSDHKNKSPKKRYLAKESNDKKRYSDGEESDNEAETKKTQRTSKTPKSAKRLSSSDEGSDSSASENVKKAVKSSKKTKNKHNGADAEASDDKDEKVMPSTTKSKRSYKEDPDVDVESVPPRSSKRGRKSEKRRYSDDEEADHEAEISKTARRIHKTVKRD